MSLPNEYLLDYIGKTKTDNISQDIKKFVIETKNKKCVDHYNIPMSLIDIHEPNQNEILGLGASVPNDLILNGFGSWFNSWFGLPSFENDFVNDSGVGMGAVRVKQSGGLSEAIDRGIQFEPNPDEVSPCGTLFRLGAGATPPDRADFGIETLLNSAPENGYQSTGNGGWNSGLGQVTVSRTYPAAVGSDTIREFGLFAQVAQRFASFITMLTRDQVSPVVPFNAGQIINVELIWNV